MPLEVERKFADLVQKQRPAVGEREGAVARPGRAGERAADVPEEFAPDQLGDDRGAVADDEVFFWRAGVHRVDEPGREFLPGAGLPADQDGGGAERGGLDKLAQEPTPRGARADEIGTDEVGVKQIVDPSPAFEDRDDARSPGIVPRHDFIHARGEECRAVAERDARVTPDVDRDATDAARAERDAETACRRVRVAVEEGEQNAFGGVGGPRARRKSDAVQRPQDLVGA
jgi:hypothetical protein